MTERRDAGTQTLLAACETCDQLFAISITWFGDPITDVRLVPEHLGDDWHRPAIEPIPDSKPDYTALEAQGWKRDHA